MVPYRPPAFQPAFRRSLAQQAPAAQAPIALPAPKSYTGVPGVIETLAVLAISGAAAWTGVRAGMKEKGLLKYAGWVGGVGSALIGLLYLGGKADIGGLPQVYVVPQGRA